MENLEGYLISIAGTITVMALKKPLWLLISGLAQMLFSDLPHVSGKWLTKYNEPTGTGKREDVEENTKLHQLGRLVWGKGTVHGRDFKYRGAILRQTLCGTYRRKRSRKPTGTGTFQLQIAGNDKSMEGWCLWHDEDTDEIEASQYKWTKDQG